jgi:excinuclease ABC subunit A
MKTLFIPWRGESMGWYRDELVKNAYKFDFPIHKPYFELTQKTKRVGLEGNAILSRIK